jgi:uncharacterized membrane protein YkvA (DUF1232 family)
VRDVLIATVILIAIAMLLMALAAAFVGWKVLRSDERKLARRIGKLRFADKLRLGRDIFADQRVPLWSRFMAVALAVYLASPIDIVPDFIPVLGQLDDLLIVMLGAGLLLRSVPRNVIEEHLSRYEERSQRVGTARGSRTSP